MRVTFSSLIWAQSFQITELDRLVSNNSFDILLLVLREEPISGPQREA